MPFSATIRSQASYSETLEMFEPSQDELTFKTDRASFVDCSYV
jgi:hypothetical protein